MKMRWNFAILVLVNGVLLSTMGCGKSDGPPTFVVKGTVTLDGKPLETGRINLVPADGKGSSVGGDIKAGKYEVRAGSGSKTVAITSEKVTGKQKQYPNDPQSPEYDVKEQIIPAKYNSNTELKVDVKSEGTTDANFTLVTGTTSMQ